MDIDDPHILVTGGAGFIGSHLVEYHLAKGDSVHAVDDLSTGTESNIAAFLDHPRFRFDQADILTWPALDKAAAWADRIYHMAAVVGVYRVLSEPIKVLATNVAGCERLLRAVHAGGWTPQVLIASSSEVYGSGINSNFREDSDLVIRSGAQSRWNYAISKLADEALGLSYARKYGLHVSIVRLFNTIGPRQKGHYGMVVPRFVEQALNG
jgi:UDP-glucose 4-epimerase